MIPIEIGEIENETPTTAPATPSRDDLAVVHRLSERALGHVEATGGLLDGQERTVVGGVRPAILDGAAKLFESLNDGLRCGSGGAESDAVQAALLVQCTKEGNAALGCLAIDE